MREIAPEGRAYLTLGGGGLYVENSVLFSTTGELWGLDVISVFQ